MPDDLVGAERTAGGRCRDTEAELTLAEQRHLGVVFVTEFVALAS